MSTIMENIVSLFINEASIQAVYDALKRDQIEFVDNSVIFC